MLSAILTAVSQAIFSLNYITQYKIANSVPLSFQDIWYLFTW